VPAGESARLIAGSLESGRPVFSGEWRGDSRDRLPKEFAFGAVLPIFQREAPTGALVMVGDARDPLTALDEGFLIALGQQVGAALERTDLNQRLQARTTELERLAGQMVRQNEEERRRLSLALHDETAQLFAAVKLQLGVLREQADPSLAPRFDRSLELIDTGIRGIRSITNDLRPALLDDLGLVPALRTLATDFGERTGLATQFRVGSPLPGLSEDAELAVYRALQEGLSNVARHAGATRVAIEVQRADGGVALTVGDDGAGLDRPFDPARLEAEGHVGLVGMRERVQALGGELKVDSRDGGGVQLRVWIPIEEEGE
jgi:two-component system sensor histidine kinase UhpB